LVRERKVLIVEDSALMGKVLSDALGRARNLKVVSVAKDSREAWEMIKVHSPDVITLDLMLPDGSGLDLLERIMAEKPTPVVVVSSLTKRTAPETFRAFDLGAVDVLEKPAGVLNSSMALSNLGYRVMKAADINMSVLSKMLKTKKAEPGEIKKVPKGDLARSVILVASSTGGPQILTQMLSSWKDLGDSAMVIVQHMPPVFTASLAQRLDRISSLHVMEASDGDSLVRGTVYIAPGGVHLEARSEGGKTVLRTTNGPMVNGVKPAADVTFESFSLQCNLPLTAVVLSGMGSDGAKGCELLKKKNAKIASQSKETCIVYGMPKAVEERGLSDAVLSHMEMAEWAMRSSRPRGV